MLKRETSGFDLSVGTGLAMESLFTPTAEVIDPDREVNKLFIEDYNVLVINWYTLIRNIINAVDSNTKKSILKGHYIKAIIDTANNELFTLNMLTSGTHLKLIILVPEYGKLKSYSFRDLSKPTINNIIFQVGYQTRNKISKDFEIIRSHKINKSRVLLFSHIALDLLNDKKSNRLHLLESHTGKLLTYKNFNKKYHKTVIDYSRLPFTELLLCMFGDSSNIIKPLSNKLRSVVVDSLITNNVTPLTDANTVKRIIAKDHPGLITDFKPNY